MKYFIKREHASAPEWYRYYAEDEKGRYTDGTLHISPKEQLSEELAIDIVVNKLRAKLQLAETVKIVEL